MPHGHKGAFGSHRNALWVERLLKASKVPICIMTQALKIGVLTPWYAGKAASNFASAKAGERTFAGKVRYKTFRHRHLHCPFCETEALCQHINFFLSPFEGLALAKARPLEV